MDVFGSFINIPFHLTTKEAFLSIQKRLTHNGVLIINVIGAREGESASFVSAIHSTIETVFPTVAIYQIGDTRASERQNILILAQSDTEPFPDTVPFIGRDRFLVRTDIQSSDEFVLTDEYAPVEALLAPLRER
jgi:spermidine synthase